jgi:hypothetical protein
MVEIFDLIENDDEDSKMPILSANIGNKKIPCGIL